MGDNSTQRGSDTIRDRDRAGVKTQIVGIDLNIGGDSEQLMEGSIPTTPSTAGDVATSLTDGRKVIAVAGTAAAIRATLACKWVLVTALKTNTADVYVGGPGVIADAGSQAGTPMAAGEGLTLPVDDAAKVFIDVLVNNEGVTFTVGS